MNLKHQELLEQAKIHYAADMLLKGTYGEKIKGGFKGCSVGCHLFHIRPDLDSFAVSIMGEKYKIVADYYDYPEWLAFLQDTIFEGLPNGESSKWHVQLAEAIASRDGAIDWQETLHRVHIGILRVSYKTAGTAREVVQRVIDLHERAAFGEAIGDELWSAARRVAAWSAGSAAYQEIRDAILKAITENDR